LLPGFERALFGLVAGERRDLTLAPADAFGAVNEDNQQRFPLYQFPPDLALGAGLMVEFADAAGNKQAGVVRKVDKQWVEVDFNHPLAGRRIIFDVSILKVQARDDSTRPIVLASESPRKTGDEAVSDPPGSGSPSSDD
jgi:FKBP-type peptidyl-prolyl cis-trans isomerase SlpA